MNINNDNISSNSPTDIANIFQSQKKHVGNQLAKLEIISQKPSFVKKYIFQFVKKKKTSHCWFLLNFIQ